MKRIYIFIVWMLLFCLGVLVGCDPVDSHLTLEQCQNIIEIQLVYYDNPEVKEMYRLDERTISFNFERMELIEVMSEENKLIVLAELPYWEFWPYEGEYDSPNGYGWRFLCENGDFLMVSFDACNYAGWFDSEGNLVQYLGLMIFGSEVSNEFFNFQIPINE